MRAIDRTTQLFVSSVKVALPDASVRVEKSNTSHGRSNYVYIDIGQIYDLKIRISDHAVGMRRALYGTEDLFVHHLAKPASWAVWVSGLPKRADRLTAKRPAA